MRTNDEIFKELKKVSPGVTCVGTCYKIKGGIKTDILCTTVFVQKKKPLSELKPSEVIPTTIDRSPTDVVEATFTALSALPLKSAQIKQAWVPGGDRTKKYRPAPGGVSVGHPDITAGTLGGWVYKEDHRRCILSNNHVLANCNEASIGDPAYQPGVADGGTAADEIAKLLDFVPIDFAGANNLVDCAIAEVNNEADVDPQIADLTSKVKDTVDAAMGMPTIKSGRTTGVTEGPIDGMNLAGNVDYGEGRVAYFVGQIGVGTDNYLKGGDSSSWMLRKKTVGEPDEIIGLLFAGTEAGWGIANPIQQVLDSLRITLAFGVYGASYGGDLTFVTKPEAPTDLSATAISDTQINLSWTKGAGAVDTVIRRKVGSYPTSVIDGEEAYNGPFESCSDTGLDPNTTYYYRAWSYTDPHYSDEYAEAFATTLGAPPAVVPPAVTTESANNIKQSLATLNGILTDDGSEACNCWFEYGITGGSISTTPVQSDKTTGALFLANLTDLTPGTRYHFRAVAKNSQGVTYGNNMYFVTESPALLEYSLIQPELVELLRR